MKIITYIAIFFICASLITCNKLHKDSRAFTSKAGNDCASIKPKEACDCLSEGCSFCTNICKPLGTDDSKCVRPIILSNCNLAHSEESCHSSITWVNKYGKKGSCAWCMGSCISASEAPALSFCTTGQNAFNRYEELINTQRILENPVKPEAEAVDKDTKKFIGLIGEYYFASPSLLANGDDLRSITSGYSPNYIRREILDLTFNAGQVHFSSHMRSSFVLKLSGYMVLPVDGQYIFKTDGGNSLTVFGNENENPLILNENSEGSLIIGKKGGLLAQNPNAPRVLKLKNYWHNYLTVNGKGAVRGDGKGFDDSIFIISFKRLDPFGRKIFCVKNLKTGKFLTAENDAIRSVTCNKGECNEWEEWFIDEQKVGERLGYFFENAKWKTAMTAEADKSVTANRKLKKEWETFFPENPNGGEYVPQKLIAQAQDFSYLVDRMIPITIYVQANPQQVDYVLRYKVVDGKKFNVVTSDMLFSDDKPNNLLSGLRLYYYALENVDKNPEINKLEASILQKRPTLYDEIFQLDINKKSLLNEPSSDYLLVLSGYLSIKDIEANGELCLEGTEGVLAALYSFIGDAWQNWLRVSSKNNVRCFKFQSGAGTRALELQKIKLVFYKAQKKGPFSLKLTYRKNEKSIRQVISEAELYSFRQYNKGLNTEYFILGKANPKVIIETLDSRIADESKIENEVDFKSENEVLSRAFKGSPINEPFLMRFEGFLRFKGKAGQIIKKNICFNTNNGVLTLESETKVGLSSFASFKEGDCKTLEFNQDEFYTLLAVADSKKGVFIGEKTEKGAKIAFSSELYSIQRDKRIGIWGELFEGKDNSYSVSKSGLPEMSRFTEFKRASLLLFKNVNIGLQGLFDYNGGILSFITKRDDYSTENWTSNLSEKSNALIKNKENFMLKLTGYLKILGGQEVKLCLDSDDGSRLVINGKTLVEKPTKDKVTIGVQDISKGMIFDKKLTSACGSLNLKGEQKKIILVRIEIFYSQDNNRSQLQLYQEDSSRRRFYFKEEDFVCDSFNIL